ncbi:MAG: hypothetical protein M3R00_02575, partial [Pseudomonadota bacterium]|nr:hypothetical protein [Pseudomonadota bacterium]
KDPEQLKLIVEKYHWTKQMFDRLISAIVKTQVTRTPITLNHITAFEELCGWRKKEQRFKLSEHKQALFNSSAVVLVTKDIAPLENLPTRASAARLIKKPKSILSPALFGNKPVYLLQQQVEERVMSREKK